MVDCACGKKAVFIWDKPLCAEHLKEWVFEHTKKKLNELISPKDKIAVAVSGGKDSTTLLEIVHEWSGNETAILIDEGIKGYRDKSRKFLENFCDARGINLDVVEFEKEFGMPLDEMLKRTEIHSCTVCGTFRRYLLNKRARELGMTKILFAHNLDDELQTLFMNMFSGNLPQITIKGELGGLVDDKRFVQRVKPLMDLPEKAFAVLAAIRYSDLPPEECPYLEGSARFVVRKFLNNLEMERPHSKERMMSFYKEILPHLKKNSEGFSGKLRSCKICGEPTSNEICKTCEIKAQIKRRS